MARHEQDREDLLREATALVERAELLCEVSSEPIVIGFRKTGAASCYLSANEVYQFNPRGELRRAYFQGALVKAVQGRLVQMERQRTEHSTLLISQPFSQTAEVEFLTHARQSLLVLRECLLDNRYQLIGQVPTTGNVVERIRDWLASLPEVLQVASLPNA